MKKGRRRSHYSKVSVFCLIEDSQRRFLVQHRAPEPKKKRGSMWGLFGGGIKDTEKRKYALAREIFEETGYKNSN